MTGMLNCRFSFVNECRCLRCLHIAPAAMCRVPSGAGCTCRKAGQRGFLSEGSMVAIGLIRARRHSCTMKVRRSRLWPADACPVKAASHVSPMQPRCKMQYTNRKPLDGVLAPTYKVANELCLGEHSSHGR